jgi:tRNA-dihydrouridine synthase 4
MEHPEAIYDMLRTVRRRAPEVKCSVKIRIHDNIQHTLDMVDQLQSSGAAFITVHGRTRKQKSTEPVNIDAIRLIKEHATVPIVANGIHDCFFFFALHLCELD